MGRLSPLASNQNVLIWASALSVGVDAIDKDHQMILAMLNNASHGDNSDADLDSLVGELIDYTHYHFRREEAVMAACHYPNIEKHRQLHRELSAKVDDLVVQWHENRDKKSLDQLRRYMSGWLISHIATTDTAISPYTKGKGGKIQVALDDLEQS